MTNSVAKCLYGITFLESRVCSLTIGSDAVTGTAGDDTISGSLVGGNQTLHGFDAIDGAGGTDTLTATIGSTLTVEPTLTSVEVVNLLFTAAGTISLDESPDVTDLKVYASTVATAVTNIESNVNLTLEDVVGANTAAFTFAADALGSATAALTLNTDGSTATVDINVSGNDVYTTATVNSTGSASVLTLDALDTVTALTITGDAALTLASTNQFTAITSISAGSFTGGLTIDLDDAAGAYTLTLGAGDDVVTADQANTGTGGRVILMGAGDDVLDLGVLGAAADDVFTGGDGIDTLIIADETDVELALTAGVSGFERLTASESAVTYVLTDFSNGDEFTIVRANAAVVTFTGARNVTTLEVNSATDTTASFARLTDGSADALTIKVVGTAAADVDVISAGETRESW